MNEQQLFEDWVYIPTADRFLDVKTRTEMGTKAFDLIWASRLSQEAALPKKTGPKSTGLISPTSFYVNDPRARFINAITWWPGKPPVFTEVIEQVTRLMLNEWTDMPRRLRHVSDAWLHQTVIGSPWWQLVAAVTGTGTPEEIETHEHLIRYMAMIVGGVDVAPGHVPLFMGEQGSGKDLIFQPLRDVLGDRYRGLSQREMNGGFTAFAKFRLITLPETRSTSQNSTSLHDFYANLKALIDSGKKTTTLEDKHKTPVVLRNAFVLIMSSNDDKPVSLADTDRRIWVIHSRLCQRRYPNNWSQWPQPRFMNVARWLDSATPEGGIYSDAVVEWLIRQWDPATMRDKVTGHAPMTEAKRDLIDMGGDTIERWVRDDLLTRELPNSMTVPTIFSAEDIMRRIETAIRDPGQGLSQALRGAPTAAVVGRILARAGCRRLNNGQAVWLREGRHRRLWVRENAPTNYDTMSEDQIADEVEAQHKGIKPPPAADFGALDAGATTRGDNIL